MTSIEALNFVVKNTSTSLFGNGTNKLSLLCTYPTFPTELDGKLKTDILIIPSIAFKSGEIIDVKINSVSQGIKTLSENKQAIWLSELLGTTRSGLATKATETISFDFADKKLVEFKIITALEDKFLSADTVKTNGLSSEMTLLSEALINPIDESAVSALRNAMDLSKTEIKGNKTNTITITNTYPVFGNQLPKTYYMDYLITFKDILPMGSEIFIKKNKVNFATIVTKKNIKDIWFSDLIEKARELLYTKTSETIELTFVYNQEINCKLITGELVNFTHANVAVNQLSYGLFQLADSKSLENIEITPSNTNFKVFYGDYANLIKSAELDLGNEQYIRAEFVTDTTTNKKYIKLSHSDESFNVSINLLMDNKGIHNYISLLRDFGRLL